MADVTMTRDRYGNIVVLSGQLHRTFESKLASSSRDVAATATTSKSSGYEVSPMTKLRLGLLFPEGVAQREQEKQVAIQQNKSKESFWQKYGPFAVYGLGGFIEKKYGIFPGFQTPTEAKADRLTRSLSAAGRVQALEAESQRIKLERIRQKSVYKEQKDIASMTWYERLGIAVSPGEEAAQNLRNRQALAQELSLQLENTQVREQDFLRFIQENPQAAKQPELIQHIVETVSAKQPMQSAQAGGFDFGKLFWPVTVIILGAFALKKKW